MLCYIQFSKNRQLRDPISQNRTDELRSLTNEREPLGSKNCVYRPNTEVSDNFLLRKEVIHPHVPVGIPCYDLTPITDPALDVSLLAVRPTASSITGSHGLTGGVYKPRERIHRDMLIRDY